MRLKITKEKTIIDEKIVDVSLGYGVNGIILRVNGWNVFGLTPDGKGWLGTRIKKGSGLQLDDDGQIILEK